jgi:hypothetical protein
MSSRIEQLLQQKDLRSELNEKQQQEIDFKVAELQRLEKKLQFLEAMEDKPLDQEVDLSELLKMPELHSKLEELNQQAQELAQLEQQLNELKTFKSLMKERQDLLQQVIAKQSSDATLNIEPVVEEPETPQERVDEQEELVVEEIEDRDDDQRMEASVSMMEQYLNLMNQDQGQQTDEERLGQLMAMLNLMRSDQHQAVSGEFEASRDSSSSKEAWTEKADVEVVESLPVKTEVKIKQESKDQDIQTTEDEVKVIGSEEISDTQTRIETAIEEIETQLKLVLQSESMIQNEEERQYYEVVVGKLKEQLEELKNIQRDLQLYKDVMDGAQFEKEMALKEMNEQETSAREEIGLEPAELEEAFEEQFKYEEEMQRLNSKQQQLEEEAQQMIPRSVVIKNAKRQQYFLFM